MDRRTAVPFLPTASELGVWVSLEFKINGHWQLNNYLPSYFDVIYNYLEQTLISVMKISP